VSAPCCQLAMKFSSLSAVCIVGISSVESVKFLQTSEQEGSLTASLNDVLQVTACTVSVPEFGAPGPCPRILQPGSSCVPSCNPGYEPTSIASCDTNGIFHAARCATTKDAIMVKHKEIEESVQAAFSFPKAESMLLDTEETETTSHPEAPLATKAPTVQVVSKGATSMKLAISTKKTCESSYHHSVLKMKVEAMADQCRKNCGFEEKQGVFIVEVTGQDKGNCKCSSESQCSKLVGCEPCTAYHSTFAGDRSETQTLSAHPEEHHEPSTTQEHHESSTTQEHHESSTTEAQANHEFVEADITQAMSKADDMLSTLEATAESEGM
jgi:hypothetical protein